MSEPVTEEGTSFVNITQTDDTACFLSTDVLGMNDINSGPDLLRRIMGQYYSHYVEAYPQSPGWVDGVINVDFAPTYAAAQYMSAGSVEEHRYPGASDSNKVKRFKPNSKYIKYVEINPFRVSVIDNSVVIPNIKIPFRLSSNTDDRAVQGDEHWYALLAGGSYGGVEYPNRLDSETVYYDASFTLAMPHNDIQKEGNSVKVDYTLKCNYYDYNYLVKKYQDWATDLESELCIPNYNCVVDYYLYNSEDGHLGHALEPLAVKRQPGYNIAKAKVNAYHFPAGDYWKVVKKDQYFGLYFTETSDNEIYKQDAKRHQENICFDQFYWSESYKLPIFDDYIDIRSIEDGGSFNENTPLGDRVADASTGYAIGPAGSRLVTNLSTFYNIELKFGRHFNSTHSSLHFPGPFDERGGSFYEDDDPEGTPISQLDVLVENTQTSPEAAGYNQALRKLIEDNKMSSKFLQTLIQLDDGQLVDLPQTTLSYQYAHKKTINEGAKQVFGIEQATKLGLPPANILEHPAQEVSYTGVNFLELLTKAYDNIGNIQNDNYLFIGGSNNKQQAALYNDDTINRAITTTGLVKVIDGTYDLLNSYFKSFDPRRSPSADALTTPEIIYNKIYGPSQKISEVLAYKVEKYPLQPTGDSQTQTPIQKFWFYNALDAPGTFTLRDSQVKFNKDYTYVITAYVAVITHKYKYGDFRLTKKIGTGNFLGPIGDSGEITDNTDESCLQFYDPITMQWAPQLLGTSEGTIGGESPLYTVLSSMNEFANNEVEVSQFEQLMDFNLHIEPCIKLIQVPIYSKTIKVMDSPPNSISAIPFHFIDNSNRIGFKADQESFIKRPHPISVTDKDLVDKLSYYNSREMFAVDTAKNEITEMSQSPARYIELFRIKTKPNSFRDFKNALIATVDMKIENDFLTHAGKIIADQIQENVKYYYILRFVNENGLAGPLSQIIQSEIINDGGYTYALFETMDSSEFNPNTIDKTDVSFKKMMQLVPNLEQLFLDTSNVDFQDYAINQINNITVGRSATQNIWDKKFKIRLTSKKTGKKIDLNIDYNLIKRNLSKLREVVPPTYPPSAETLLNMPQDASLDGAPVGLPATEIDTIGVSPIDSLPPSITIGTDPIAGSVYETYTIGGMSSDVESAADPEADSEAESYGATESGAEDESYSETVLTDAIIGEGDRSSEDIEFNLSAGVGFPATIYNFLASRSFDAPTGVMTGREIVRSVIVNATYNTAAGRPRRVYDAGLGTITGGDFIIQQVAARLVNMVYQARYTDGLLTYMDEYLVFLSACYLAASVPIVADADGLYTVASSFNPASDHPRSYIQLTDAIFAETKSRFSGDTASFTLAPGDYAPDFSYLTIASNLGFGNGAIETFNDLYNQSTLMRLSTT